MPKQDKEYRAENKGHLKGHHKGHWLGQWFWWGQGPCDQSCPGIVGVHSRGKWRKATRCMMNTGHKH